MLISLGQAAAAEAELLCSPAYPAGAETALVRSQSD